MTEDFSPGKTVRKSAATLAELAIAAVQPPEDQRNMRLMILRELT
jgi:hypothetical protein